MRNALFRATCGALLLLTLASCAHLGEVAGGREPASSDQAAEKAWDTCRKLDSDGVRNVQGFLRSALELSKKLQPIARLSHVLRLDKEFAEQSNLTLDYFFKAPQGVWEIADNYFMSLLADNCRNIREGGAALLIGPKKDPGPYEDARKLCGPADEQLDPRDRAHPDESRSVWLEWADSSDQGTSTKVREQIAKLDQLRSGGENNLIAPDRILDKCVAHAARANAEDMIEGFYVCLYAFTAHLLNYDYALGKYLDQGQSDTVLSCAKGVTAGLVEVDRSGRPVGPRRASPPVAGASVATTQHPGVSGATTGSTGGALSSGAANGTGKATTAGSVAGTSGGKAGGKDKPNPNIEQGFHFPGDRPAEKSLFSSGGGCLVEYGDYAKRMNPSLPSDLTAQAFLQIYQNNTPGMAERDDYSYQLDKHQVLMLMQGYVLMGMKRKWEAPVQFDSNLKEFVGACGSARLRTELGQVANTEFLERSSRTEFKPDTPLLTTLKQAILGSDPDPSTPPEDDFYDDRASRQTEIAAAEGGLMVAAAERIEALRKLVTLLNQDFGASEVSILHLPDWLKYLPFVRYAANAPASISFGNQHNYQCGLFRTLPADDFEIYSKSLVTRADDEVRRLFNDESFRKLAFCDPAGHCKVPDEFSDYLGRTHPLNFTEQDERMAAKYRALNAKQFEQEKGKYHRVSMKYWCQSRFKAAQALGAIELELINRHPALAYADPVDPKDPSVLGKPVLETLLAMKGPREAKVKLAEAEARRALPVMQRRLIHAVGKICDDLIEDRKDSAYIATLDPVFRNGFDYCASLPPGKRVREGVACEDRLPFIQCMMNHEAADWKMGKEMPGFAAEVGMMALDIFMVYSLATAPLKAVFTVRGLIGGGLGGVAFTAANAGLTYAITRYNEGSYEGANEAKAGLVLEGIDSYTNAITAISASYPKPKLHDFIVGFVLGAVMSGNGAPEGRVGGAGASTIPKVFAEELANRVTDAAEPVPEGGVRFNPDKINQLKEWIAEKDGESPGLAEKLEKKLIETMESLSDDAYKTAFDGAAGKLALSKVRQLAQIKLRRTGEPFNAMMSEARQRIAERRSQGKPLTEAERSLDRSQVTSVDLERLADNLGPRETVALADAAEESVDSAAAAKKPEERASMLDQFLKKLCMVAVSCPQISAVLNSCAF